MCLQFFRTLLFFVLLLIKFSRFPVPSYRIVTSKYANLRVTFRHLMCLTKNGKTPMCIWNSGWRCRRIKSRVRRLFTLGAAIRSWFGTLLLEYMLVLVNTWHVKFSHLVAKLAFDASHQIFVVDVIRFIDDKKLLNHGQINDG